MRTTATATLVLALALAPALALAEDIDVQLHELDSGLHVAPDVMNAQVGGTLNLTVSNQGQIAHDLVVCGDGPTPPTDCKDIWGFIVPIQAGESAKLVATMKKAGTFSYYCSLPGHAAGGMRGTLNVQGEGGGEGNGIPGPALVGTLMTLAAVALFVRRNRA